MSETNGANGTQGATPSPGSAPAPLGVGRVIALALVGLGAVFLAYFAFFLATLMIAFSFDSPDAHFTDSGLWFRLLALWPPVSLLLVAVAAIACIFTGTLRLLWVAGGLFISSVVALVVALQIAASTIG